MGDRQTDPPGRPRHCRHQRGWSVRVLHRLRAPLQVRRRAGDEDDAEGNRPLQGSVRFDVRGHRAAEAGQYHRRRREAVPALRRRRVHDRDAAAVRAQHRHHALRGDVDVACLLHEVSGADQGKHVLRDRDVRRPPVPRDDDPPRGERARDRQRPGGLHAHGAYGRGDEVSMARFFVAVADSVFPNLNPATAVLSEIGAELELAADSSPESVMKLAADADAVLVTYAKMNADMIRQMKKVRIISRFGIGVDNVDLDAATQKGIVVTKVPDYCIDEVSDHAMALLLTAARKIPLANDQVHSGTWKMPNFVPIHRLRGSVLGLVGFGRIPQLVAPKAKSFGMRVVASDPYVPTDVFKNLGVEKVEFADLLKTSDYVSVHSPLTPETKGLFNADAFSKMKKGSYVVNTARGPIIDEAALAAAIDSGQIAGAALDVMTSEPPTGSPLIGKRNVILTPHTSFYSEESLVELQTKAAQEVANVLTGKPPRNPVNPGVLQSTK